METHPDFKRLFTQKESIALTGKNYTNVTKLIGMLTFAFLVIGFANGSLTYLNQKVNDAFVKWITLKIPGGQVAKVYDIEATLNTTDLKEKYKYTEVNTYKNYYLPFYVKNTTDSILRGYGRSFQFDEPLVEKVFDAENNEFVGQHFQDGEDIGLVLTKDFLKKFGYSETDAFVQIAVDTSTLGNPSASMPVPIPIRAVVKSLPGASQMAFTPYFYQQHSVQRYVAKKGRPFNPLHHSLKVNDSQLFYHVNTTNKQLISAIESNINYFFTHTQKYAHLSPTIRPEPNEYVNEGENIKIIFYERMSFETITAIHNDLYDFLQHANQEQAALCQRVYAHELGDLPSNYLLSPDYLSINLLNANRVRDLRDFIRTTYQLEIDISRIEALENYHLVAFLTKSLAMVLLGFSLLSVCLYSNNLLSSHLKKIEMNLGTFKAFGLSEKELQQIYITIMLTIVAAAMIIALAITCLLGYFGLFSTVLQLFTETKLEAEQTYFLPNYIVLSCLLIMGISYMSIRYIIKKNLHKTPGDLIYGRET